MTDIFDVIRETGRSNPNGDTDDLARRVLAKVTKEDLVLLIAREIQHWQRAFVRRVELTTFRSRGESVNARRVSTQPVFTPKLLSLTFSLGDGSAPIRWGEATLAQHKARLALLEKQRDGINQTIERHVAAIAEIERHGVACLDEIVQEVA